MQGFSLNNTAYAELNFLLYQFLKQCAAQLTFQLFVFARLLLDSLTKSMVSFCFFFVVVVVKF